MYNIVDLKGVKFGRLLVIKDSGVRSSSRRIKWKCQCNCGNDIIVSSDRLIIGHTKSCGCLRRDNYSKNGRRNATIHGCASRGKLTKEYIIWRRMIQRCTDINDKAYHNYGGRGITVCDRWRESFQNFLDDMGECPDGCSIERIDNNNGYNPDNCEWATSHKQHRNMRTNVWVVLHGESMIMADAIRLLSMNKTTVYSYMRRHDFTHQEAVNYYSGNNNAVRGT